MRIIGFGVCGPGEADRELEKTLLEFERLCDETVIVANRIGEKERHLLELYDCHIIEDNAEWGKWQHKIKEENIKKLARFNPDWVVTLDMDETFDPHMTREDLEELAERGGLAYFFYVVNLYGDGYIPERCFFNVRMFKYEGDLSFEQKPLHPGLAPKYHWLRANYAPYLLLHTGLRDKANRMRKVDRYNYYDPDAQYQSRDYYSFLAADLKATPLDLVHLREEVHAEVSRYNFNETKGMSVTNDETRFYIVRRLVDGRELDIPELDYEATMKTGNFERIDGPLTRAEYMEQQKPVSEEPLVEKDDVVETIPSVDTGFVYDAASNLPEVFEEEDTEDEKVGTTPEVEHVEEEGDQGDQRHACDECDKDFKTEAAMKGHKTRFHKKKPWFGIGN